MNEIVVETQRHYRSFRELTSFNIIDIETELIHLANEGKIWMILGMKDLTESETILIHHYLNDKRELQIYDSIWPPTIPNSSKKAH